MRANLCFALSAGWVLLFLAGCSPSGEHAGAGRGAAAIARYGCGACHTIPGIPGAHGLVGPTLAGIRSRVYIAGNLENNAASLERWIEDPHAFNPRTAMPNLRVTTQDAADITEFLYSMQ